MRRILIFFLMAAGPAFAQQTNCAPMRYKLIKVRGILSEIFTPYYYAVDFDQFGQDVYVRIDVEHGTQCAITPRQEQTGQNYDGSGRRRGPLGVIVHDYSKDDLKSSPHGRSITDYFVESCEIKHHD